ncbi:serine hydrolase domain-containing protein [Paenibacillus flagellatus]|uniref:6-aminohexanoate hydrolase n=1 Tax=Paenibacillus flagellatus TaxID=2211139 RepID=A0A2V5KVK3_9BACL|nr:serine hydrolase [Paenibacillus flagellatus]PYI56117.1 6-aminohexanoate hydrolase [Paenibacillus flagellatus]
MQRTYWPTTVWQTADPAALGMDADLLTQLDPAIRAEYGNISGIVVVRSGYIAYERYYNGCGPDDPHHVASVTKSILSALVGIAIEAGFIRHVDQNVLDFFPDYVPDAADKRKRDITIRHLLTMTAPYPFADWHEPLANMCMQPDWVRYTLDMLGQGGSIGDFKYSTAGAHLLSAILSRTTGKSAREFANERLFKPIGMKEVPHYEMESFGFEELFGSKVRGWVEDPNGSSAGGWGLTMTPRDMARFGLLYVRGGTWDRLPVIPRAWIDESKAGNPYHYGYLWWLREEEGIFAYSALGDGGNVICCIPDNDLVVAITSRFDMNPRDRWTLIKDRIVTAIKQY